ncbi:MAG: ATP-binding protein [Defluviitaleaceae bacterium]|nr:ATP-binding protein [Defluviitaleaceae bacterium]
MNRLHKLSIRNRLFLSFGCMILILLAFSIIITSHLNIVIRQYDEFIDSVVSRQIYVDYIETSMTRMRLYNALSGYLIEHPELYETINTMQIETYVNELKEYLNNYRNNVMDCQILSDEGKAIMLNKVNEIEHILNIYYLPAAENISNAITNNDAEGRLHAILTTIPIGSELSSLVKELHNETFAFARYRANNVTNHASYMMRMVWIATASIIPFGVFLIMWLTRAIQVPIKELKSALGEITKGNFKYPIRTNHNDELGSLSHDIADMVDSISITNKAATVADYLDTLICVTDSEKKLIYINKSFADAFGIDINNYEGKFCSATSNRGEPCGFCVTDTTPHLDFVWDSHMKKWYTCRVVEVHWPDGRLVNLHYRNDATELKNHIDQQEAYEEQLEAIAKVAEAASAAKSTFIANTSHEIRTPLNSILGYSELALDDPNPNTGTTREYFRKIVRSAKWLLVIINDILDISKIEANDMSIEAVPFDVNEVLSYCQSSITPLAIAKDIELFFYTDPFIGKRLIGDPSKLSQVCSNILSNAVKFTEYGIVKFSAEVIDSTDDKCSLLFEIRDSGIGMDPEQISQIFEPFSQGDTGSTRKQGGTGLGLAIAKRLVEAMGGELQVESALGIGSKFSFTLTFPTIRTEIEELIEPSSAVITIPRPYFGNGEVLVVEDNEMSQGVICEHLKRVGLAAVVMHNGLEAVELIRQRIQDNEAPFDLVLMDIHMPIMDGLEASSIISKWNTGTPIVAMTANVMTIAEESYEKCGMEACISKPYTVQDLWTLLLKYFKPTDECTTDTDNLSDLNLSGLNELNNLTELNNVNDLTDLPNLSLPDKDILIKINTVQSLTNKTEDEVDDYFHQKMLSFFVKNNQNTYTELKEALALEDMVLAHRIAHNLKSNAGHIQKSALQKIAADLEKALKDNQKPEHLIDAIKLELDIVLEELSYLMTDKEVPSLTDAIFNKEEFQNIAEELEPLLQTGNAEYLVYVDRLKALPGCEKLAELIENFDSSTAATELTTLKEKLLK